MMKVIGKSVSLVQFVNEKDKPKNWSKTTAFLRFRSPFQDLSSNQSSFQNISVQGRRADDFSTFMRLGDKGLGD